MPTPSLLQRLKEREPPRVYRRLFDLSPSQTVLPGIFIRTQNWGGRG